MCGVDSEECWVLDVCAGTPLLRGHQRVLYEAVLMKEVKSKRLEVWEERDQA